MRQQRMDVGRLHNLKELVGGIVLQATDGGRGVKEGKALLLTECHDVLQFKPLGLLVNEVVAVTKEHSALDTPVVIDEIGVIEVHAPPFPLGRKTA